MLIGICSADGRRISSSVSGNGEVIRQTLGPDACGFSSGRRDVSVENVDVRRQQSARARDNEIVEIDSKLKNKNEYLRVKIKVKKKLKEKLQLIALLKT